MVGQTGEIRSHKLITNISCQKILNEYHFLFSIHVQEGKVALSMNNYIFILIFYRVCYKHNNKNTTTTPSTGLRTYFPPKAIFQIQDWAKND